MAYPLDHPTTTPPRLVTQALDFLAKVCPDPAMLDGARLRKTRGCWVLTVWMQVDDGSQIMRDYTMA